MAQLTYEKLGKIISKMSKKQQKKVVAIRDYANQETHVASDCLSVIGESDSESFQIGFDSVK